MLPALLGTRKTSDIAINANKCVKNATENLAAVLINDPQLLSQVEVSLLQSIWYLLAVCSHRDYLIPSGSNQAVEKIGKQVCTQECNEWIFLSLGYGHSVSVLCVILK